MTQSQEFPIICDICVKEGAQLRYVSRSYGEEDNLLVIENVPVISCPHCGQEYLTAETLDEIERCKAAHFRRLRLENFLEEEVWPQIPDSQLGIRLSTAEEEEILGFEE